jgi:hypothetical protein
LAGQEIAKHPFWGNGINAVVDIGGKLWGQVHSTYVDIAFKYGIPALVVFCYICWNSFRTITRISCIRKRALLGTVLFVHCIHNITDAPYLFCMIIPMCVAEFEVLEQYGQGCSRGVKDADRQVLGD